METETKMETKSTEPEIKTKTEPEMGAGTETETNTETETKMETKTPLQLETEAEMETKTPLQLETEAEMETKTPLQLEMEAEMETKTPLQLETEMEAKTEMEMETETETEAQTETETKMENGRAVSQLPLPRFIVMRENTHSYAFFRGDNWPVTVVGQLSVFDPMVKIEVEREKSNPNSGYVHLRFCHSNRYWHLPEVAPRISADATEPEEDVSNRLCTLFSFTRDGNGNNGMPVFTLVHVHTGLRVRIDWTPLGDLTTSTILNFPPARFQITDWSTLVNLPPRVAFKGYNDKYLRAVTQDRWYNYHKFESDDPNEKQCGYEVFPMNDGHVRIRSDHWEMFWQRNSNWIWGNAPANTTNNRDTLFWPVLVDNERTIGLRNAGNNMFCAALSADRKTDCLSAVASTTTNPARLVVEELVSNRNIYNIRYRMEHSRIFGETPFLAGSSSVTNHSDQEASMAVEIEYTSEVSNSFNNSITLTAGMTNTFEGGIPWIFSGRIEVYMEGSYTREWGQTVTTSQTIKASGSVAVPPRTVALISFIGARGTCNVPFSYTQQDRSSTSGIVTETEKIDGIFEGVNSYDFQFVVTSTRPITRSS